MYYFNLVNFTHARKLKCPAVTEANYKAHAANGAFDDESDATDDSTDDDSDYDDDDELLQHILHTKHDRSLKQDGLNNNNSRKLLSPEVSALSDNCRARCRQLLNKRCLIGLLFTVPCT